MRKAQVQPMSRGDVSFTFLDRVTEVEQNILDQRWQSALALALTLPDICGGIAFPEIVKKYRDGRVMRDRNGEPSRDIGKQYIKWVDIFAAPYLKKDPADAEPYISGERCWQLRCEYLHQNKGFDNEDGEPDIHFHLGINCGTSVCQLDEFPQDSSAPGIRVDIQEFCTRLCLASREYYEKHKDIAEFDLYNTPVIDFIKWNEEVISKRKTIMIIVSDCSYGRGLQLALESTQYQTLTGFDLEDARKKASRNRIDCWITDSIMLSELEKTKLCKDAAQLVLITEDENTSHQRISRFSSIKELRKTVRSAIRKVG